MGTWINSTVGNYDGTADFQRFSSPQPSTTRYCVNLACGPNPAEFARDAKTLNLPTFVAHRYPQIEHQLAGKPRSADISCITLSCFHLIFACSSHSADVEQVRERIRHDCQTSEERAKRAAQQGSATKREQKHAGSQATRRYEPLRIVVREELLALNLDPFGGIPTKRLQEHIEHVAYGVHDSYRFPSVRNVVPEPHLLAVATLEAVRRGADLRHSGGKPAEVARRLSQGEADEGRPFILFPGALARFLELAAERRMFDRNAAEGKRVFRAAIELHEAQGAILLTNVDGGGEIDSAKPPVFDEHLVIYVNPAWLADLVRRIVDIRLVNAVGQEKVMKALKTFARLEPSISSLALSTQHHRFFQGGEVSREYLDFLWTRDMQLGPASQEARPLEMTEDERHMLMDSLFHARFMFEVRDDQGGVVPGRYVVASCLPDHVGSTVDPGSMLDLEKGGALFFKTLAVDGSRIVPLGLVPRLLAWCGRGRCTIQACWKRGVCFSFKEHLVLVFERRTAANRSSIECYARGSAHNYKAKEILRQVVEELDQLIRDDKYGFPGVDLFDEGEGRETVSLEKELEPVAARLEAGMRDHMNVRFEELERKLDDIAGE